jgi:hypothetical protein
LRTTDLGSERSDQISAFLEFQHHLGHNIMGMSVELYKRCNL